MKIGFISLGVLIIGTVATLAMNNAKNSYSLHYKVTVAIETPEGVKTGSTVREISNAVPILRFPGGGNPGGVRGEAVVVDLGERGKVFALIDDKEDHRFYNAFPPPEGAGGASPPAIQYYATLKTGATGILDPKKFPGPPRILAFKDINDANTITSVISWHRKNGQEDDGYYYLGNDRFEELFGKGFAFKEITYEITDKPVSWGKVEKYLPDGATQLFLSRQKFKQGEPK